MDFVSFDTSDQKKSLDKAVADINSDMVKNILILGETKTGKTTWIDTVANQINYETLEKALQDDSRLYAPIPALIDYEDESSPNGYSQIKVGIDDGNEVFKKGHSSTQCATVYPLLFGDTIYNLIDTPGMGDTRGPNQDKKNMANILAMLNSFDHIHAVCILMKPDVTALTPAFSYCIVQLLAHLHKSACNNIMFCFTHTRATFYSAPGTKQSLNVFFKEDSKVPVNVSPGRLFYFDNEAFRLLALAKNGIQFKPDVVKDFAASWERSSEETGKLFEAVSELDPHLVKDTISLNEAKEIVLNISESLTVVYKDINKTKREMEAELKDAKDLDANAADWEKKTNFEGWTSKVTVLDKPYTACTEVGCFTVNSVREEGTQEVMQVRVYTPCHIPCSLQNVPVQAIGDEQLARCAAFWKFFGNSRDLCNRCGHSYKVHQHLIKQTEIVKKNFSDQGAIDQMRVAKNKAEQKRIYVKKLNEYLEELGKEEEEVIHGSALLATFLKQNAIYKYNDHIQEYITLELEQACDKKTKAAMEEVISCINYCVLININ